MQRSAHRIEVKLAGNELWFETGRIARQASGAVFAGFGDCVVLATVVAAEQPKPGQDFFPLTVEYRERFSAAGRIPPTINRREGRITDHEVLVSRLIDRTARSLFPEEYRCEVQIQVTVFSAEPTADIESLALLAAMAALHVSPVPARGPGGGLRIARTDGQWVAFPAKAQREAADLLFTVGTGPDGLVMLEGDARDATEADCLAAIEEAAGWIARFQKAFEELAAQTGRQKGPVPAAPALPAVDETARAAIRAALQVVPKAQRRAALAAATRLCTEAVPAEQQPAARAAAELATWQEMREMVLATGRRIDGRSATDIRQVSCDTGLLPRTHGSALFTRGETQALVACTLGSPEDAMRAEGLAGEGETVRFLLHYNFPPYSVNEAKPLRGPGRREIGHGSLARRGLAAVLPDFAAFPYTIRLESEITESNGSSSMASACGGSLALLHAGVPLLRPVAGIAMGLITDGRRTAILSDILGDEDHLGDMDFKVVGTERGVTAIQLDNKVGGLSHDTLAAAFDQARVGRLHILGIMNATLASPATPSRFVPRALRIAIMPDSVGALIGSRGANIKAITAATGARVSVDDNGLVLVYATSETSARAASLMVARSAGVLRAGRCYRGTVTGIKDFGVFVRINPVNEGLVPVEELDGKPVRHPGDIAREGEEMVVMVLGADDRGRLRLSRRQALDAGDDQIEF